jgi:hypothetical protein
MPIQMNTKTKKNLFLVVIIFLVFPLHAQKKISKASFLKNLQKTEKAIKEHHLGLSYYQNLLNFNEALNKAKAGLPDSLSTLDVLKRTALVTNSIRDRHTSAYINDRKIKQKYFPFIIRNVENKFLMAYNQSRDSSLYRGLEILSIDQKNIVSYLEEFKVFYEADNKNPSSQNFYNLRGFSYYHGLTTQFPDSSTVMFKDIIKDSVFTKKVLHLTEKEQATLFNKRYKNMTRKNLKFIVLDSSAHIGILDINSFTLKKNKRDHAQLEFKRKTKTAFREIEKAGIKDLIIDFRANGGGFVPNIKRLTAYVSPGNFGLLDTIFLSKATFKRQHPWYNPVSFLIGKMIRKKLNDSVYYTAYGKPKYKPCKKYHFDGNLHVLIDGGSYSATTFTSGLWKDMGIATFYGNTAGGANWGSFAGQWRNLKMGKSGVVTRIPLKKMNHFLPQKLEKNFAIHPDYFLGLAYEDFIKKEDSQIKFIVDKIKNNK